MSGLTRAWERIRANDFLTGMVAVGLAAVLIAGVSYFYMAPPGRQAITFTTRDVASLSGGEDVRVAGISVGKVADVRLRADDVEVELDVTDDVVVGDRSSVRVQLLTAVGGYFVSLIPSGRVTDTSRTIPADRVTVPYTIADTLQELPRITNEVDGDPIESTLAQVADGLGENSKSLRHLIDGMRSISTIVDKQRRQVDSILAMASDYMTTFANSREFVFELIRKVNVALSQFHTYRAGFSEAYRQLGGVLQRLGAVSNFYLNHSDQIYAAVVGARNTADRLRYGMDAMIDNLGPLQSRLASLVAPEGAPDADSAFVLDATAMCLPVAGRKC
ncbi:MlaD family protein [Gordonia rubripertincta]|uniref:MlaD family protein n=1 Tax=Gordonia rubripertincta TaxID=36822 RepID=UPI000B8DAD85|nr:MlaD family protein [Gordonia rubripertincta]ASR01249.1 mce related protein [Gordonia rubripertincta]